MTPEEFNAAARIAEIYFNIAAEAIGEDEVRRKRDLILDGKNSGQIEPLVKPTLAEKLETIRDEVERIMYRTFPDRDREDGESWDDVYNQKEETCKHATTKIFEEIISKCSL